MRLSRRSAIFLASRPLILFHGIRTKRTQGLVSLLTLTAGESGTIVRIPWCHDLLTDQKFYAFCSVCRFVVPLWEVLGSNIDGPMECCCFEILCGERDA